MATFQFSVNPTRAEALPRCNSISGETSVATASSVAPKKKKNGFIQSIFMHANRADWFLMVLGIVGSLGNGFTADPYQYPLKNNVGSSSTLDPNSFTHHINKNAVNLLYLAAGSFLSCFLKGYWWTRTGKRQAARMRARYSKAVLRQDVAYFDLHVTSTLEVITRVSNDSLVIQDAIAEKMSNNREMAVEKP